MKTKTKEEMKKRIFVCKKFKFNDLFLKSMLKNEPRAGRIYRVVEDDDGFHLGIKVEGIEHQIFLSGKEAKDPRYSYSFEEITPETFLTMSIYHPDLDAADMAEWLDKPVEFVEEEDMTNEPEVESDENIDGDLFPTFETDEGQLLSLQDVLDAIYGDIFFFNKKLGETMVDAVIDLNKLFSERDYLVNVERDELFQAVERYKNTGDPEDLTAIHLIIIYLMYKEKG